MSYVDSVAYSKCCGNNVGNNVLFRRMECDSVDNSLSVFLAVNETVNADIQIAVGYIAFSVNLVLVVADSLSLHETKRRVLVAGSFELQ